MSLVCTECGTLSADGTAFCTGCGISLALATTTAAVTAATATPSASAARNPFPSEPAPSAGGARALPWLVGGGLAIVVVIAAVAAANTGWQALQRMHTATETDEPVPVTLTLPAAADTTDEIGIQDAAMPMDTTSQAEDIVVDASPPPTNAKPPVVAPRRAQCRQPAYRNHPDCRDD